MFRKYFHNLLFDKNNLSVINYPILTERKR